MKKKLVTMFVFECRNANGRKIGEYFMPGWDVADARKKLKKADHKIRRAKCIESTEWGYLTVKN